MGLDFPWIRRAVGLAKARKSNGFVDNVAQNELITMVQRNQAAHAIVMDVGSDAVGVFECVTPQDMTADTFNTLVDNWFESDVQNQDVHKEASDVPHNTESGNVPQNTTSIEEFDTLVQILFEDMIRNPITQALQFTRRDGYCGILIGYADNNNFESVARETSPIEYLQPIPKDWVDKIVYVEEDGNIKLPLSIERYEVMIGSKRVKIDASRIVHIVNPTLDASTMEGESSLECIFDLISVLKSMDWGVGQAMWRHGGGLTAFVVPDSKDQQAQIDAISELVVDINAMTTLTLPHGTEMLTEGVNGLDPEPYYNVIINQIALGTRIPSSVLTGSQAGTLTASMKDRHDYCELLDDIRTDVLTPALMDIIKKFQLAKMLPDEEFIINWEDVPEWIIEEDGNKEDDDQKTDSKKDDKKTPTEEKVDRNL